MSARTDFPWFVQIAAASYGDSGDFGTTLYALASDGSIFMRQSGRQKWEPLTLPLSIFLRDEAEAEANAEEV